MSEQNNKNVLNIADLTLKPSIVNTKSDQKKVEIKKNLFSKSFRKSFLRVKEISLGTWTIEKEERCNICWVNIKSGEDFTRCTSCNNKFHTEHWRQWIMTKGVCPMCKVKPMI